MFLFEKWSAKIICTGRYLTYYSRCNNRSLINSNNCSPVSYQPLLAFHQLFTHSAQHRRLQMIQSRTKHHKYSYVFFLQAINPEPKVLCFLTYFSYVSVLLLMCKDPVLTKSCFHVQNYHFEQANM